MKNKYILVVFVVAFLVILTAVFLTNSPITPINPDVMNVDNNQIQDLNEEKINVESTSMPEIQIDQNKTYFAKISTSLGDFTISLNATATPITVNNFVSLSKKDFYNETIFHRIIKGFMIQGGDPTGTGSGGPGYQFNDEPFDGEYTKGTVAMANAGPNTNGSQFFIMHEDMALPKNYVIFGEVTEGLETIDKIAEQEVTISGSGEISKPLTPTKILSIEIIEQ